MGKVRSWKPAQRARGSSTTRVPQLRDSWEKRLQQRAERAAVQAAQAAIDDQIRTEKQARRTVASLTRRPPHPSLCAAGRAQAARGEGEEKGGEQGPRDAIPSGALRPGWNPRRDTSAERVLPNAPQISNTAKIKKMSKKQLRQIKKMDTTGVAPKPLAKAAKSRR